VREDTIKLYKIDELPKEQQEKICDQHRDINVRDDFFCFDGFIEKAEAEGFQVAEKNIYSDPCGGQGSGTSFTCKVDVLKFIDSIDKDGTQYPLTREKYKEGAFNISITKSTDRYCHEYTMQLSMEDNIPEPDKEDLKEVLGSALEDKELPDKVAELGELIIDRARELARELHKDVEETYLDLMSDESIIETIKANDWEFEMGSTDWR
jgi:hypothetical protein